MLLEALVAILIFSLGILALVGMQANALREMADAKYRTDAAFLVNQVIGEMWVNRTNLATYNYTGGTVPGVLQNWVTDVGNALPGAAGANNPQVVVAGQTVTVTVRWQPPNTPVRNHTAVAHIYCC